MASLTLTAATTAAQQLLGVLDSGGAPSSAQLDDALLYAQNMIDNANDDPKMAISSTVVTVALTGAAAYVITRYSKLLAATVTMTNGVTMPVRVLQDSGQFYALVDASSTSALVQYVWYNRLQTSPQVYVSPVAANGSLGLTVPTPILNFADKTIPVVFAQGYDMWIKTQLAIFLSSTYDVPVPDSLTAMAARALQSIETLNAELLGPSPAMPPVAPSLVTA